MPPPSKSLSDRFWGMPYLLRIGLLLVIGMAGAALFGVINRSGLLDDSTSVRSAPTSAADPQPAAVPAGQIGPGVYLVGSDVQPGTYRTAGASPRESGTGYCMWSRHSSAAGGPLDDIVSSDGGQPGEQLIVTIGADDVLFRTSGCDQFQRIG